jgi:hypothetical protein
MSGRHGLILEHVARWVRPNENHTLAIPPRPAMTLTPALQALIGYHQHNEFLGFIAGRPPLEWLAARPRRAANEG